MYMYYLVRSALPLVVLATMFVNPIPYSRSLKSCIAVIGSGINPDKYIHFPENK